MNNGKLIVLDDYRKTPAVLLTTSQEARTRLGHDIVEALRDQAQLERAIEEHIIAMGFGDIV